MRRCDNAALVFMLCVSAVSAHAESLVINGQKNVVIEGKKLGSPDSDCMRVSHSSDVIIRNSSFVKCAGVAISIENSSNVTVESSYFEDLNGGIYALKSSGIKVVGNRFKNVSRAGKLNNMRGQFVQFDKVTGPGNEVSSNRGINEAGKSDSEDLVSLYKSSGTAESPIRITGNCFKGGGPSDSGGGLMSGDNQGAYVVISGNTLVDVGQYGVAVAGGHDIKLMDNKIYGRRQHFTNVGLYVWNQTPGNCRNITVSGNQVDYTNRDGVKNSSWDGGNCGAIGGWSQNDWHASLSDLDCSLD